MTYLISAISIWSACMTKVWGDREHKGGDKWPGCVGRVLARISKMPVQNSNFIPVNPRQKKQEIFSRGYHIRQFTNFPPGAAPVYIIYQRPTRWLLPNVVPIKLKKYIYLLLKIGMVNWLSRLIATFGQAGFN